MQKNTSVKKSNINGSSVWMSVCVMYAFTCYFLVVEILGPFPANIHFFKISILRPPWVILDIWYQLCTQNGMNLGKKSWCVLFLVKTGFTPHIFGKLRGDISGAFYQPLMTWLEILRCMFSKKIVLAFKLYMILGVLDLFGIWAGWIRFFSFSV